MDHADHAHEILDTLLGYLGFVTEIAIDRSGKEISLQVATGEPKPLIGHRGERLDDIQYLVIPDASVSHPECASGGS
ncbi:hypothetical protein OAE25_01655 [Verrucomicrobiales bacterium]|nr:hypothetical protein [Verrucomicrobiales bacterium]MDB4657733.1 hypothetical protein [Verrucomicrobiales bacterium]MDC0276075.1 hypothetical protein [Verrucomicrobiales bacterium]MDC0322690.1 hypothetical protein [Verrucomicrobiales bacterium]